MRNFWFESIYFYGFDIAAFFNFVFIFLFSVRDWKRLNYGFLRTRVFRAIAINGILSAFFDIVTAYTNTLSNIPADSSKIPVFYATGWAANILYLGIHNMQPVLFLLYVLCITRWSEYKHLQARVVMLFGPYLVSLGILVLGSITGRVISYDLVNGYTHGPMMPVFYVVSVGYLFGVLYATWYYWKELVWRDRGAILLISVGALVSVAMQVIFPNMMIELFVQSLMFFSLLISLESRVSTFIMDTGCFSLQSFTEYTKTVILGGKPKDLVIVKCRGFDYYTKFVSLREQALAKREFSDLLHKVFLVEDIYECADGVFGLYMKQLSDYEFSDYYRAAIAEYQKWERKNIVTIQMTRLHIPEDAPTAESIWGFVHSNFKIDKQHPYLISDNTVKNITRSMDVEQALMRGLEQHTIQTVFQPIVDKTGRTVGAEALSRMEDPVLGTVRPYEFITVAESNGLIWELGLHTIEDTCRMLSQEGHESIQTVDVNLSVVQCLHGGCRDAFMPILEKYHISPSRINFEITESAHIDDEMIFVREKDDLKAAGFSFSIDDYGTGFSNYQYVNMVGPSLVKLDRSMLLAAMKSTNDRIFYKNTVKTIHDLHYGVIAEGIETEEQFQFVTKTGVDYIQGFYYSKPLSKDDFSSYVKGQPA